MWEETCRIGHSEPEGFAGLICVANEAPNPPAYSGRDGHVTSLEPTLFILYVRSDEFFVRLGQINNALDDAEDMAQATS